MRDTLNESGMKEIATEIEELLKGSVVDTGSKVSTIIAKQFNISKESAINFVNQFIQKKMQEAIGSLLAQNVATYNRMGGAEELADEADTASTTIAKQFEISKDAATKFVNDYVDSEIAKFRKDAEANPSRFKKDYDGVKEGVSISNPVQSFFRNIKSSNAESEEVSTKSSKNKPKNQKYSNKKITESEDAGMVVENKWYEMMLSSSNVKRFQAKDNKEAKALARKSKAESLIRCTRDGMPVGKIGNNLLKESVSFKQYLVEEKRD